MNKNLSTSLLSVFLVFLTWFLVNYLDYGSVTHRFPNNRNLVIPFLWSCIFIYLHGKNHLYVSINSYAIFLLMLFADKLNFGQVSQDAQLSYLILSVAMAFIFVFVYQELQTKKPRFASIFSFLSTISLFLVPIFYIVYAINTDAAVTKEVFYAIMQTNQNESLEFVSDQISPLWIFVVLLLAVLAGYLLLKQEKNESFKIERSLLIFMVIMLFSLSFANRENIRLYNFAEKSVKEYWKEIALFKKTQLKLNNKEIEFSAEKTESGETYIVVIGESLNKKHMGLYGYMRNTTPLLSKLEENGDLLVFDNAYSSHALTMQVLSQSLTEANQHNKKDYFDSLTIIDILNKAGLDTYWISNQTLYGQYDNLVTVIAHQADHLTALNRNMGDHFGAQKYDESVIAEVKNVLSMDSKGSKVIFVHLVGNHTKYSNRYPGAYEVFSGKLPISEFGKISTSTITDLNRNINSYDNSVLYNDNVVSSLIKSLEKENGVSGLLYFSDHGEDVINKLAHNSGNFTWAMTQIPLTMWFSDDYKKNYREKYDIIKGHKKELFSNDDIYDSLIGIFNINTERYQTINDLSSSQYFLDYRDAFTLHGKISYADKSNYYFHQKRNIKMLKEDNQTLRIIPYRVNTIGGMFDAWTDGYRAFKINVYVNEDGSGNFKIGKDANEMSGLTIEQFIVAKSQEEIAGISIDIKNLTKENYRTALNRLNYLGEKFSLKNKLIIESETEEGFYKEFQKAGWHTSYHLPTDKIIKLLNENKTEDAKSIAAGIFNQSKVQDLSAVSFDQKLYPFVKQYLEPLLSDDIVYHVSDPSTKLYDSDLKTKLSDKAYTADNRVNTIALPYKSPFHL